MSFYLHAVAFEMQRYFFLFSSLCHAYTHTKLTHKHLKYYYIYTHTKTTFYFDCGSDAFTVNRLSCFSGLCRSLSLSFFSFLIRVRWAAAIKHLYLSFPINFRTPLLPIAFTPSSTDQSVYIFPFLLLWLYKINGFLEVIWRQTKGSSGLRFPQNLIRDRINKTWWYANYGVVCFYIILN